MADGAGEDWNMVYQIVVPAECRQHILNLAHEHPWSGHLGVTETYDCVLKHFFWPGLKGDLASSAGLAAPARWKVTQTKLCLQPLSVQSLLLENHLSTS